MPIQTGTPYVFGPMQLSLPDSWSAEFQDGVHEILPPDGDFVIHISGFDKDTPVVAEDLLDFARDQTKREPVSVELASGLDGITFDEVRDDQSVRFWLIRHESAMIAVTLTSDPEDFEISTVPAQMIVSTLRPWRGD